MATLQRWSLDDTNNVIDVPANNNGSISFKFKEKTTDQAGDYDVKYVEIMVPLKYLINVLKTLEMPWIICKIIALC